MIRWHIVNYVLCVLAVSASALTPSAVTAGKTVLRSPNVVSGKVSSIDLSAHTISIKPTVGAERTFGYTDRTQMLRNRRAGSIEAYAVGDAVTVRYKRLSASTATLYDLADSVSWEWLDRIRHETCAVTVAEATEEGLSGTVEAVPVEYRVTPKTQWSKQGKAAQATDYKAGEIAYVSPRLLPSGKVMAVGVSDSPAETAKLRERASPTVTGVITAIDAQKRAISLRTKAGDQRDIEYSMDCLVRRASQPAPISALKPGLTITAHLKRNAEGARYAASITIQSVRPIAAKGVR